MSVLNLETDVKPYLTISRPDNDTRLQAALDAAEAMMAKKIGPLTSTQVSDTLDGQTDGLKLTRFPVIGLVSLADWTGATQDITKFYIDAGVVRYLDPFLWFWQRRYVVTYNAGYSVVPAQAIRAIAALTQHLWGPQRGPGVRGGPPEDGAPLMSYAMPNFVQQMVVDLIPLGP